LIKKVNSSTKKPFNNTKNISRDKSPNITLNILKMEIKRQSRKNKNNFHSKKPKAISLISQHSNLKIKKKNPKNWSRSLERDSLKNKSKKFKKPLKQELKDISNKFNFKNLTKNWNNKKEKPNFFN
jgi:hypothetical protein